MLTPAIRAMASALPLLVSRVLADHEDPSVAADDLALLAHRLDRRSYLHGPFRLMIQTGWLWWPERAPLPIPRTGKVVAHRYLAAQCATPQDSKGTWGADARAGAPNVAGKRDGFVSAARRSARAPASTSSSPPRAAGRPPWRSRQPAGRPPCRAPWPPRRSP